MIVEQKPEASVDQRGTDGDGMNTQGFTDAGNNDARARPPPYRPSPHSGHISKMRSTVGNTLATTPNVRSDDIGTGDGQPQSRQPLSVDSDNNKTIAQQPQGGRDMEIIPGGHKNAKRMAYGVDGDRDWSHGLCDCSEDWGTCCLSCWCPCMVYSQNKHRLEHLVKHGTPEPSRNAGACSSDCCIHAVLIAASYGWAMQMAARASIRMRYHIRGGGCHDCLASLFCTPCQLTQESREIELEEQSIWNSVRMGSGNGDNRREVLLD